MGVLPVQVVRRAAWEAVVHDVRGSTLTRFALFPRLYVVLRMALPEPTWLWDPGPTFLLRTDVGNSVVEELGGDLTRYHLETTAETVDLWRELVGEAAILQGLLAKTRRAIFPPSALIRYKVQCSQSIADDVRLLTGCVGWFWRLPGF